MKYAGIIALVALGLTALGKHGYAATGIGVLVGQRSADFHRFSGGRGHDIATGSDTTIEAHFSLTAEVPLEVGAFYSSQSFSPKSDQSLFDEVAVTEVGPHLTVRGPLPVGSLYFRYAHTVFGTFKGTVANAKELETGGGTTNFPADSLWQASMTGSHVSTGWLLGSEFFQVGLWLDMGFQQSKAQEIRIDGANKVDEVGPYVKRDGPFQSSAILLSLQVGV